MRTAHTSRNPWLCVGAVVGQYEQTLSLVAPAGIVIIAAQMTNGRPLLWLWRVVVRRSLARSLDLGGMA